jgi:hypothetical protein
MDSPLFPHRLAGAVALRTLGRGRDLASRRLSEYEGGLVEGGTDAVMVWQLGADRVVPAAQVLHEGMSGCDGARGGQSFASSHRAKPRLQSAVIDLDGVIGEPVGDVPSRWHELFEQARVDRGPVGQQTPSTPGPT